MRFRNNYSALLNAMLVCGCIMKQSTAFPMFPPAVLFFPQYNIIPQNVPYPLMSQIRMATNSLKPLRRIPNFVTQEQQPDLNDQHQEFNGHQNPNPETDPERHPQIHNINEENNFVNYQDAMPVHNYNDIDTVAIEPETEPLPDYFPVITQNPDGRLSIGQLIMAVPWLPLEVNVPDTIAWMYNGISSIIGGIGQRIPFINRPSNEPRPNSNMNVMKSRNQMFLPIRIIQMPMINMHNI